MKQSDDFGFGTQIRKDGSTVGKVTTAVYSPRLEQNIGLAMVAADCAEIGAEVEIAMPQGPAWATVIERPFFDPKKQIAAT